MKILITGGAGFIGSAVARYILEQTADAVLVVDKLTYAANPATINALTHYPHFKFIQADITDVAMVNSILTTYQPDAIMHLAAESHVDKSIDAPGDFIQTNIVGTYQLLTAALSYYNSLSLTKRSHFRFHHVSTDEVYGELTDSTSQFTECTAYAPSSPYSASKASADHLVRAWYRTFGLPIIITNSANNYGPYQFPEKLIPLTITRALKGLSLPIYGQGDQVRDWIYVDDHAKALYTALCQGRIGETYNIGANCEQKNRDVIKRICLILDEIKPARFEHITDYMQLITSVEDRPGHDKRYAVSTDKIEHELGWRADQKFDDGLYKTIIWYLDNQTWWQSIIDGSYRAIAIDTGSYLD